MVNWSLAGGGNSFTNAFAQGAQIGKAIRERKAENALSAYVSNQAQMQTPGYVATPEQQARSQQLEQQFAKTNPTAYVKIAGDARKREQQAQARRLQGLAAQGDQSAMAQLAGIDLDAWSKLDTRTRAVAKERAGVLGNAALDVLNRPPEQRAQAWDSYIDQLSVQMPEVAKFKGQYSEQSARSAVAQAEMIGKLHDQERPSYQVVPQGADLVNTRSPQAVQEYARGVAAGTPVGQGAAPPPPPGFQLDGGPTPPASGSFPR